MKLCNHHKSQINYEVVLNGSEGRLTLNYETPNILEILKFGENL
mgnify:CR=1 FL=1